MLTEVLLEVTSAEVQLVAAETLEELRSKDNSNTRERVLHAEGFSPFLSRAQVTGCCTGTWAEATPWRGRVAR